MKVCADRLRYFTLGRTGLQHEIAVERRAVVACHPAAVAGERGARAGGMKEAAQRRRGRVQLVKIIEVTARH
jgi:hypothetical protein